MDSEPDRKEEPMIKPCPFKDDRCDIWLDYTIMEDELSQCNELLHSNWIEIIGLYDRIDALEKYILSIGGEIPDTY